VYGESCTTTIRTIPSRTPILAAEANDTVQPRLCSAADRGAVAATAPTCPSTPVIWVTMAVRAGGNHRAISCIRLMKIMASPMPTKIRAATPAPNVLAKAKANWPPVISTTPVTNSFLAPTRSRMAPTGTCMAAYTNSCTIVNVASWVEVMWNRCAAMRPATPNEVR